MFKKVLCLLLLLVLAMGCMGSVSATHHTYKVNTTQYTTFNLNDWMDGNGISSYWEHSFTEAFQGSDYFVTFPEPDKVLFPDHFVTSIKLGSGRLTVSYPWPGDDDYIDFIVNPRSV